MTSSTKGKNGMNDGVAMLIERMKTNPEEFVAEPQYGATKWGSILQEYRPYLDKEDLEAFDATHKATVFEYMKQRFTEKVMEELIEPKALAKSITTTRTWDNRTTIDTSAYLDAQRYQTEQMKLHLDAHREAIKQQEAKPTTLFGKLFNYQ